MKTTLLSHLRPPSLPTRISWAGALGGLLLLPAATDLGAQDEPKTEAAPDLATEVEGIVVPPDKRMGCVWKVKDEDNTVYLAGSVHLLRESDYPVSPVYDEAYGDSEEIVMEIDMGEMMKPEGIMRMQQLGTYPEGDSLDQHLAPDTLERLRTYLDTHESGKMVALAMPRLKPGMIFMTISSLEAMRLQARPDLGLEMVYYQKAKEDGKPVTGLETMEFQMTRFDEMTDEEIEALILKTLDEIEEMADMINKIIAGWHEGDVEKLDQLLNMDAEEDARLRELLLTERNHNWIPPIEEAIKGGTNTLFLVGAAHLIGEESVVDLLEKKGYEVTKLEPDTPLQPAVDEPEPEKTAPEAEKDKAA